MNNPAEPYLSLVVASRNDDHGGNLMGRTQMFLDGWLTQARRYNIPSELIFVEWNPPADRPPLAEALKWPADVGPCTVRFIQVPTEVHQRYKHGAGMPLYQMIGKNAGIRRARGRFILATNIDILFSNELAAFLGEQRLEKNRLYRVDRYDAMSDVPPNAPLDEQLAYCRTHLIRINRREGTFEVTPDGGPALSAEDIASPESGILLGQGWFTPERSGLMEPFRWAQAKAEILLAKEAGTSGTLVVDLEPGPASLGQPVKLEVATDSGQVLARLTLDDRSRLHLQLPSPRPNSLWFRAQGEFSPVSFNTNALVFRAFRLSWEHGQSSAPAALAPAPRANQIVTLWGMFQYVIGKLADGGPLVPLTVPVSPRLRRILRFYIDRGGLVGMIRHPFGRPRPLQAEVPAGDSTAIEPAPYVPPLSAECLHTNASGDFQLAAREHWFDLRGYPEFDMYSMNIDSAFCFAAQYSGAVEEFLADPMRIYHIEHGSGSGWTPDGQQKLYARLAAKGIPVLDNEEVLRWASQMRRLNSPIIFNHDNWGLEEFDLKETAPVALHRAAARKPVAEYASAAAHAGDGGRSGSKVDARAAGPIRPLVPQCHPVLNLLSPRIEEPPPGFEVDFLGIQTRLEFLPEHPEDPKDEYFEWVDLVESILAAQEQFTMMELGSGFGRWSVRAAALCRQLRQLPFHLVAIEGEPRHHRWTQQHLLNNGIPPSACTVVEGVLSDQRHDVLFYVGTPSGGSDEASYWYGQSIIKAHEVVDKSVSGEYEGRDILTMKSGWKAIQSHTCLLTDIMPETGRIDLIDMDIQGDELKVLTSAIDELDKKVARLHIATHSHDIEAGLRELLRQHGWKCKADYPCDQTNQTPWGPIQFVDGIQSWVNTARFPEL